MVSSKTTEAIITPRVCDVIATNAPEPCHDVQASNVLSIEIASCASNATIEAAVKGPAVDSSFLRTRKEARVGIRDAKRVK